MPRAKEIASAAANPAEPEKLSEPEKPVESDGKVDFDGDDDAEEMLEEEVEYEEVEEEEEVEVIEEEVEEEEEEEEEEVEEEEDEDEEAGNANNGNGTDSDEAMLEDKDEKRKHAELLALPPHGSEVYVGAIPHDTSEEDLRHFCESIGEVTQVRIMKGKDSGENKGFAFVTFRSVELASKAIEELNNSVFKDKRIKCSTSQAKHRLFIGNIPRNWRDDDLKKVVKNIGPGVTVVELVKDMKNSSSNRGFAFIDYYNHACADYSRQKMMNPEFKLSGNAPTISWADPRSADSPAASQVKAVYVANLPKNVTQDQLKMLFEHHGRITKVVLPPARSGQEKNRIGFVHFAERSSAIKALKNTEKYELDGQVLECSLAKPQADQNSVGGSKLQKPGLLPAYPPVAGYGLAGGTYNALDAGYGSSGFGQPLIFGQGATPAGMAMMPMLLPDGRIGYVLQQAGVQPQIPPAHQRSNSTTHQRSNSRSGGGGGGSKSVGSSSRGRHSNDGGNGHRYRPY